MVYGHKYHTTTMDRLTTDWIGPRMYRPSLEGSFAARSRGEAGQRRALRRHVPLPEGRRVQDVSAAFADRYEMRLDHKLVELDPKAKTLRFADGKTDSLRPGRFVDSAARAHSAHRRALPDDVRRAAKQLAFTTAVLINLGIDRADLSDAGITYFYDEDIIFSRVNLPHMFSPSNAPPGCGTSRPRSISRISTVHCRPTRRI